MAKINELFPSRFLKASDLAGQEREVTMVKLTEESVTKDETKPALTLEGVAKMLVLNKTNAETISAAYGPETDAWMGRKIILFSAKVQGPNGLTDGIRCRVPAEAGAAPASNGDSAIFGS